MTLLSAFVALIYQKKVYVVRPGYSAHPDVWHAIGGKSDFDENSLDCVLRETQEETALELDLFKLRLVAVERPEREGDWTVVLYTYELSETEQSALSKRNEFTPLGVNELRVLVDTGRTTRALRALVRSLLRSACPCILKELTDKAAHITPLSIKCLDCELVTHHHNINLYEVMAGTGRGHVFLVKRTHVGRR